MRPRVTGWLLLLGALLILGGAAHTARAGEPRLLVFAAASTTNALSELGELFAKARGVKVLNSFASSSTLAKQIARGAPAQVYVSANLKWMDYLEKKGLLVPGSRVNIAGNRLVLIAPAQSPLGPLKLGPGVDLAGLLGGGRLALGDPSHVPAGMYAQKALQALGVWDKLRGRLAAAANVRLALAMVERGEAPLGVVYATDAAISRKVKVVGRFPAGSHPPIVYPAALVAGQAGPAGRDFLEFLRSPQAAAVFRKYGFEPK